MPYCILQNKSRTRTNLEQINWVPISRDSITYFLSSDFPRKCQQQQQLFFLKSSLNFGLFHTLFSVPLSAKNSYITAWIHPKLMESVSSRVNAKKMFNLWSKMCVMWRHLHKQHTTSIQEKNEWSLLQYPTYFQERTKIRLLRCA